MYDHILLPTDGSLGNRVSAEEAVALARLTGATVHALYVVDTRDYSTLPESKWLTLEDERRAEGEQAVAAVADRAERADVPVTTAVERGIPHEESLAYADANDVDVIVMGTHGRTGLNRFLIGSVTEKVIRSADVPVLVIRISDSTSDSDTDTDADGDAGREAES